MALFSQVAGKIHIILKVHKLKRMRLEFFNLKKYGDIIQLTLKSDKFRKSVDLESFLKIVHSKLIL